MFELSRISFTAISYETEDLEKVKIAMLNLLPLHLRSEEKLDIQRITGQFRDKMYFISLILKNKKQVVETTKYIFSKLSDEDLQQFTNEYETRFSKDETTIYLRFNKFDAYNENITLQNGSDVIKATIKYNVYKQIELSKIKNSFFELIGNKNE